MNNRNKKNPDLAALLGDGAKDVESKITKEEKAKPNQQSSESPENKGENRGEDLENGKGSDQDRKGRQEGPGPAKVERKDDDEDNLPIRREEPKIGVEAELDLPKAFTRTFKRNPAYDKAPKTTTVVYEKILKKYKNVAGAMETDMLVLVNNVLADWYNKHLETIDKVINRKEDVDAL